MKLIGKSSTEIQNPVKAAIINDFATRFVHSSELLFVGDGTNKELYVDKELLNTLGITISKYDKFPDVILYDKQRKWLFLIEAANSHGSITSKRKIELENMFKECKDGKVYFTAFSDSKEYSKYSDKIAWGTDVWIKEFPEHTIHYDGGEFMSVH